MSKYTPEQIKAIYKNLPDDLKEAIFSVDTSDALKKIGDKYKLTIDKMGEMADETGLLMLGITRTRDFISNLTDRLGVEKNVAREIAQDINVEVFSKVRESLKSVHVLSSQSSGEVGASALSINKEFVSSAVEGEKKEILKVIENNEVPMPEIMQGAEGGVFKQKAKEEIYRMPVQEKKYPQGDPYRETF